VIEAPDDSGSLYERLGGRETLEPAVDLFYRRLLDDWEVAGYFAGVDVERLVAHQKAFLTSVLGGPSMFSGRHLREAHAHLGITDRVYDVVLEHLLAALRDLGAAPELTVEVFARLEGFRGDVVAPTAPRS
jgi:hemoglobin